jgi:hypothetical protein
MPVAALSGLLYKEFTRFSPEREARFSATLALLRAGQREATTEASLEVIDDLMSEASVYMRERGVHLGYGLAPNDGDWRLTMFRS